MKLSDAIDGRILPLNDSAYRDNAPASTFTLAHLSDPHLTQPREFALRDLAGKRLLGYLSWLKSRRLNHRTEVLARVVDDLRAHNPDHIVVSGDLTHLGLTSEYIQAAQWLKQIGTPYDVSVVLGNHERYADDAHWHSAELWQDYMKGDNDPASTPAQRRPGVRIRGEIAIISVDTCEPSAPLLATGRIGEKQLAELAEILEQHRGRFRVVVMHHSPLPNGHKWRKRLIDAAGMMAVLQDVGAELVLHGHGHYSRATVVPGHEGQTCIISAPSASLRQPGRAGWNAYAVSTEPDHWSMAMLWRRHEQSQQLVTERTECYRWSRRP